MGSIGNQIAVGVADADLDEPRRFVDTIVIRRCLGARLEGRKGGLKDGRGLVTGTNVVGVEEVLKGESRLGEDKWFGHAKLVISQCTGHWMRGSKGQEGGGGEDRETHTGVAIQDTEQCRFVVVSLDWDVCRTSWVILLYLQGSRCDEAARRTV